MTTLSGLLDLGSSALWAQRQGIAVAGRNIANAATEGYSRERVDLSALRAAPTVGGVLAGDPGRIGCDLLSARERSVAGSEGRSAALSHALLDLESLVTSSDSNVAQAIGYRTGAITSRVLLDPVTLNWGTGFQTFSAPMRSAPSGMG